MRKFPFISVCPINEKKNYFLVKTAPAVNEKVPIFGLNGIDTLRPSKFLLVIKDFTSLRH